MNLDLTASPRRPAWKWWVCGLLLLATMLNYMDRLTLNLTGTLVMRSFALNERHYGQLESAFAFAFALGSITFGWLADRINVRWLYPAALLAWSAAGFATGLVESFAALLMCRFCLGLFEGSNWPCALRTTQRILPPAQRAMGNSILQSGAAVGAVVTPLLVGALVVDNGAWFVPLIASGGVGVATQLPVDGSWRLVFLAVGGVGLTWVLLWLPSVRSADLVLPPPQPGPTLMTVLGWLVLLLAADFVVHLPDVQRQLPALAPAAAKVALTVLGVAGVFLWLRRATADDIALPRHTFFRRFWVLVTLVVTINTSWHFLRAWLPLFLQTKHGYSVRDASNFFIGYYLATDVGSLTAGFVTLYLVRRHWSVFASRTAVFAVCCGITLLSLTVTHLERGWALQLVLMVVGFGVLGLFPVYYAFSQELTSRHQGKLTGCLGCITWLVMSLLHELVGDWVKETKSYAEGLGLAGLAPLAGLAALLLFWRPQREEKPTGRPTEPDSAMMVPAQGS
jgi:ACS family hexuronate transporter-like MFS transporter